MDDHESIAREIRQLTSTVDYRPEFFGPVPDATIEAAERELNLKFPKSYRAFLRHFGASLMLGYSFDGLPNAYDKNGDASVFLNVVDTTKRCWRGIAGNGMPKYLIYVTSDEGDYMFYIDTSKRDSRDECPIVVYGPGADGIVVAADFLDFLRKLANNEDLF